VQRFERVRAGDLVPNPKNWRTHGKQQTAALNGVLGEIGFAGASLARELSDGQLMIIDGHLRKDVVDAEFMMPVLILDVDESEADKLLAMIDPIGAMAGADPTKLNELVASLEVNDNALRDMIMRLQREKGGEPLPITEDNKPAAADASITKHGDIWILGNHRLMCGDSGNPEHLDRLLAGAPIHLVNTDPPYNVKVEPRSNNAIAAGLSSFEGAKHHQQLDLARFPGKAKGNTKQMRAKDRPLQNDFMSDEAFDKCLDGWFGNIARVLVPGRCFYIWGGYANCANYPPVLKAHELYFSQAVIWVKEHPVMTRKDFMGNHEWCFYGWRLGAGHQFLGPANATDVWSVKKVSPQSMVHLTEKPVELAARAMQYSSRDRENVLDLFGGSGSTMMAAEQLNRHAFLMELDTQYADVIVERWRKFTGREPVLEGAGQRAPKRPTVARAANAKRPRVKTRGR
jgi:DNA modification methylase